MQTIIGTTMPAASGSTWAEKNEPRAMWLQRLAPRIRWPEGQLLLDAKLVRLWSRKNGTLGLEHELSFSDGANTRQLRLQGASGDNERLQTQRTHAHFRHESLAGIRILDQSTNCLWCSADRDRALNARKLFDPVYLGTWLRDRLQGVLPGECAVDFGHLEVRVIAHRLGKRCVMRIRTAGTANAGLYIKIHAHAPPAGHLQRLVELTSQLEMATCGRFRVPELLLYDAERRITISREMPLEVQRLDDTMASEAEVAVVLAALHAVPPRFGGHTHSTSDELSTVLRWRSLFTRIQPELPLELFHSLIEQLNRRMPEIGQCNPRMIHRDLHAGQIGSRQGQIWIVDWDTCCIGSPELDIATFMAHRIFGDLISVRKIEDAANRLPAFLAAYTRAGGRYDARALRWHLCIAMTRLGALQGSRGLEASHVHIMWNLANEILHGEIWNRSLDGM